MRKVLFLTTLAAFLLSSAAWAADISGTWTIKMQSPMGSEESFDLAVKDAGGNLTITGTHPQLQALTGTGTVKGDAVTMDVKATGQMAVEFIFTGKLAGNKIAGTREIKMSGSGGAPGGAASAESGAKGGAPAGAQGGAKSGAPAGGQGGAPGGAPAGGQGGAPAGGQGGAPGGAPAGGQGGAPGGAKAEVSNAFTAEKK
jgi:hypothetical protein